MIELREITWENFHRIINLSPHESQLDFLPSNAVFMAQAYVNLKSGYPDACFALYHDSQPVGFTKIVYVPKDEEPYHFPEDSYMIDALMIDKAHQGKGCGGSALRKVLEYIGSKPFGEATAIKLTCYDANPAAVHLYLQAGFSGTDQFKNKEKRLRFYEKRL